MNRARIRHASRPMGVAGVSIPRGRVLHVVSSLQVGGMERFALRLAARQRLAGLDARLLALRGGPLEQAAQAGGVPVTVIERNRVWQRVAGIGAAVLGSTPQIVHAHNATSLHYAALIRRATGARLVMTHHGSTLGAGRLPAVWEWRSIDALAGVSHSVLTDLPLHELAGRVSVIHNGITPPAAAADRAAMRRALELSERPTGIIVARMDGNKGHSTLIEALARLRNRCELPTLLMVGDGRARPEIEALAVQLKLPADSVRFLGSRPDVENLLAAADFFVLPSRSEGLPLSILEAMCQGLPVIGTRVGGIPEIITHGEDGLLVPVDEIEPLAQAIAELCTEPLLRSRLGNTAIETVRSRFSFEGMFRHYEALYARLGGLRGNSSTSLGSLVF